MTGKNLFQIGSGWFPERKGGAENVFYSLFQGLHREGFRVRGVVPSSSDVAAETTGAIRSFETDGVTLPRRAILIRSAAGQSFADAKPDIVASHFALYCLPLLDRIAGLPHVVHFHGPWATESASQGSGSLSVGLKRGIEKLVYRRSSHLIVLSRAFASVLEREYRISPERIRLVPGGVDCDRFDLSMSRADASETLGWDASRPTVLTVRRLVRRMGLDRLIDAVAMLRQRSSGGVRDIVLHIAGTGPERETLEEQVVSRGLAGSVVFDGFISDERLPLAFRAADLTVVPSTALEGFGLVAAESLAAGTPVLTTPIGGLPEVVSGLSDQMILAGADVESIAEGLQGFMDGSLRLPDKHACCAFARQTYDWTIIVPKIAHIYRGLC